MFWIEFFLFSMSFVVLQLGALKPSIGAEAQKGTSLLTLIKDPYILCAAGEEKNWDNCVK